MLNCWLIHHLHPFYIHQVKTNILEATSSLWNIFEWNGASWFMPNKDINISEQPG